MDCRATIISPDDRMSVIRGRSDAVIEATVRPIDSAGLVIAPPDGFTEHDALRGRAALLTR